MVQARGCSSCCPSPGQESAQESSTSSTSDEGEISCCTRRIAPAPRYEWLSVPARTRPGGGVGQGDDTGLAWHHGSTRQQKIVEVSSRCSLSRSSGLLRPAEWWLPQPVAHLRRRSFRNNFKRMRMNAFVKIVLARGEVAVVQLQSPMDLFQDHGVAPFSAVDQSNTSIGGCAWE